MLEDLSWFSSLVAIGFFVGSYGSLIGAGGGFILVPALLLLFPDKGSACITAMSLTVVFFNAYGGSWAYAQRGRIDYTSGVLFAVAGIPGALLGTWIVKFLPRGVFDAVFACLLLGIGLYLVLQPVRGGLVVDGVGKSRTWDTADGRRRLLIGSIGSAYLGLVSTLLGIGGGILHVPFMVRVLGFAPHVATATSHFVLAWVAFTGSLHHLLEHELDGVLAPTAFLALGVMMGAPVGAACSFWLRGPGLIRLLAVALMIVGVRLLWRLGG
jgi:uncharacterized membrane protein YfcA